MATTRIADLNRQPNSQTDAKTKCPDISDGILEKPKTSKIDAVINNNNNIIDDAISKGSLPLPKRLSEAVQSVDGSKKPVKDDNFVKSGRPTPDVWKCYQVFTSDPKLKPRLPDNVLDFREGGRYPLTTGSVVSMPESSCEVFKIETIENKK